MTYETALNVARATIRFDRNYFYTLDAERAAAFAAMGVRGGDEQINILCRVLENSRIMDGRSDPCDEWPII